MVRLALAGSQREVELLTGTGDKKRLAEIAWTRNAFLDLLRIRASTPLLRLSTTEAVKARLSFPGSGPGQNPALVAIRLDGAGLANAGFKAVMLFIYLSPDTQTLSLPAGQAASPPTWTLHPLHRRATAADQRAAQARFAAGVFKRAGADGGGVCAGVTDNTGPGSGLASAQHGGASCCSNLP